MDDGRGVSPCYGGCGHGGFCWGAWWGKGADAAHAHALASYGDTSGATDRDAGAYGHASAAHQHAGGADKDTCATDQDAVTAYRDARAHQDSGATDKYASGAHQHAGCTTDRDARAHQDFGASDKYAGGANQDAKATTWGAQPYTGAGGGLRVPGRVYSGISHFWGELDVFLHS
ncbi:MAG: hypothetical protein ABH814_04020 [bacterium]